MASEHKQRVEQIMAQINEPVEQIMAQQQPPVQPPVSPSKPQPIMPQINNPVEQVIAPQQPPVPPSKPKPKPKKEDKKKYPQLRKQLFAQHGLSILDHFLRDCFTRYQTEQIPHHTLFAEASNQTLTHIGEAYLPKFTDKDIKLRNKALLQVFTIRDVAKSQQRQDQLNTGSDKKRMLHFVLTDGKIKVNAVEYQHCSILDNQGIYPGSKMQLENAEIRNGVILLRPACIAWIGGDVESFKAKYIASIKAREGNTRVHQKNLLKGETPPPQFEDNDLTAPEQKHSHEEEEYYNQREQYNPREEYNPKPKHKPKPKPRPKSAPKSPPKPQSQPQSQPYERRQDRRQYNNNDYYGNEQYYEEPYQNNERNNNGRYQNNQQRYDNRNNRNGQQRYEPRFSNQQRVTMPQTLMELYGVQQLPFTSYIVSELVSAVLRFDPNTNDAFIEFDVSDSTGKCKGMTSNYLMQWIVSKYGNQINQAMVDAFFNEWGKRFISIKMELVDPQRMVVFHEIKWQ